mmetsp:Transcript_15269/g.30849  ORF Transcript_15269/g.30849 Transcript_15269/m.30849 type:complete len:334 (+) Transcript_15269:328-1329(+)|eukprot:CAMPEP_0178472434 /NCGR_PEP_ID=MMETSP0696-20121128/1567_1 /TAXON_ID=265572 /ORGANISM="Extubocellulus spinifer, Strain CCMP396" /LENGTH=333 /DNA_ID=CAMNT_0020099621 /DNA_START=348 /DNA_END=1349 /DNA_ORIENTATION=-
MSNNQSATKRTITDAIAGAAAGAFARTAVAPIDRVKLIVQLRGSIQPPSRPQQQAPLSVAQHRGAIQIFRAIMRDEGVLSLWRGNAPTLLIEAGSTALNFVFLDWYKIASGGVLASMEHHYPSLREENGGARKQRILRSFVSGGLAGATTITFLYPLAFMRTRLAVDVGVAERGERMFANGMRDITRTIWSSDGIRGFYKGYGIALISVSMHRFVYLGGYDYIKSEYAAKEAEKKSGEKMLIAERFAAAQFVSMVASTLHYPLDCVRRRLMMEAGRTESDRKYRNTIHCFRRVWAEEGYRGFLLGLGPNLVRCIGSALVLVSYDEFKRILTAG